MKQQMAGIVLGVIAASTLLGGPLVIDDDLYGNGWLVERGRRMMVALNIDDGVVGTRLPRWEFPVSLTVNGISYDVNGMDTSGFFDIHPTTNRNESVVSGRIHCLSDEYRARICCCGRRAMSAMSFAAILRNTKVETINSMTNAWRFSSNAGHQSAQEILLYKNMFLTYRGVSNKVDFAIALLNAGLPETERLPQLQSTRP